MTQWCLPEVRLREIVCKQKKYNSRVFGLSRLFEEDRMKCWILLFLMFTSSMAEMLAITFHTGVGGPEPLDDDGRAINNVTDLYFEQRLNHFSIYEERTWMQVCTAKNIKVRLNFLYNKRISYKQLKFYFSTRA